MSKKIKKVYDDNPTRGDDLTEEVLIPGDLGDDTPVTFTRTQLSNHVAEVGGVLEISDRVSALETGTTPDPTTAFWNVTILDNTLTANVSVSMYTGTAYRIVKDSDVTPTDDSVGSTPPTGFTPSLTPPITYDMVTWASGELYFYQWDETNGIVEKLRQDGFRGIVVTPNDTIAPSGSLVLSDGGNADTEIDWTITASDSGSGINTALTELVNVDTLAVLSVGAASGTLTGLVPGDTYNLQATVYDNNGNPYDVVAQTHTTAAAVSLTGTIEFTETTNPAYTIAEDNGPLTVSLTLTDRSDSDEKSCTISTRPWTTDGTGQVTALVASPVTFAVGSDPQTDTVNITLTDQSLTENNKFEVFIDDGSAAGDALGAPAIGLRNSILVSLTGSGTTAGTALEDYTHGGVRQVLVLDSDMTGWTYTPGSLYGETYSAAAIPSADTPTDAGALTNSIGHPSFVSGGFVNLNPYPEGAYAEIPINLSATGNWYIHARGYASAGNRTAHFSFDQNWVNQNQYAKVLASSTWETRPVGTASGSVPTGYSLSAGEHTFNIATREMDGGTLDWDLIVISDDPTFDETAIDAALPLARSVIASAEEAIDNPDNPSEGLGPVTTARVTPVYSPVDGASDVQTNVSLSMTVTGGVGIRIDPNQLTVTDNGGVASGSWSTDGVNVATFTLDSGQSWTVGGTVTVVGTDFGSVIDTDLSRKFLEDLTGTDWSITIAGAVTYIQEITFDGVANVPRLVTPIDVLAPDGVFHSEGWQGIAGDDGSGNTLRFVSDPKSSGKSTVIEGMIEQGNGVWNRFNKLLHTRHYDIVNPVGSTVMRTVYGAEDVLVMPGYRSPSSVHFGALWSSPDRSTHAGTVPDDITPDKCRVGLNFYGAASGWNPGDNALALYVYHNRYSRGWYGPYWMNSLSPASAYNLAPGQPGQSRIPIDRWFTVEYRLTLNTFSGLTPNSDGVIQAWIDGVLVVDAQNQRLITVDNALGINMITHSLEYAGDNAIALADDYIWRDNLRYSTGPITH